MEFLFSLPAEGISSINFMLRKTFFFLLLFLFFCSSSSAESAIKNIFSLGGIRIATSEISVLSLRTYIESGDFVFAGDGNLFVTERKSPSFESLVLRTAEYDNGTFGIRFSPLSNITFGSGLLIKNYSGTVAGPILLNNQQIGAKSYYISNIFAYEAFGTSSHIYGVRFSQDFQFLSLGESYVADPNIFGYSVDFTIPLGFDTYLYGEAARLKEYGSGTSLGILWGYNLILVGASARVERRFLDSDFIPEYFNSEYEINPIDLLMVRETTFRKDGILAEVRATLLGSANFNIVYENYEGSNYIFGSDLSLNLFDILVLGAFVKQPAFKNFRTVSGAQGDAVGGGIELRLTESITLAGNYKKVYNPTDKCVDESTYIEAKLSF